MTSITLQIPLRPVSINKSYRVSKKFIGRKKSVSSLKKSDDLELFERLFHAYLLQLREQIGVFAKEYDPERYALNLEAFFYVPQGQYFTKPKSKAKPRVTISRDSLDLDNCLKATIDNLFRFMQIDDKNITAINAHKIPTDNEKHLMILRVMIVPFPSLNELYAADLASQ